MSPRIFVTADTHFGHSSLASRRGFASVEEHDALLIEAWNSVVGPRDEVWHLGDFALGASPERCAAVFKRLRGRKILVRGNHDRKRTLDLPWHAIHELATPKLIGRRWVFCHYPMRAWMGAFRGTVHVFGHTHGKLPDTNRSCDAGVDRWGYRPAALEEVLERVEATAEVPEEIRLCTAEDEGEADAE